MQLEILENWIKQGTEPMLKETTLDCSNDIKMLFGNEKILNPTELSTTINDLINELLSFEWWFHGETSKEYSLDDLIREVKHNKVNFIEMLLSSQYVWAFDIAVKRIKSLVPDKLDSYFQYWELRMENCGVNPNNPLYVGIFKPMLEQLKAGGVFNPIPYSNQQLSTEPKDNVFYYELPPKYYIEINNVLYVSDNEKFYTLRTRKLKGLINATDVLTEITQMNDVEIIKDQSLIDYYNSVRTFNDRNIFSVFYRKDVSEVKDDVFMNNMEALTDRAINLLKHYDNPKRRRMLINNMIDTLTRKFKTPGLNTNKTEAIEGAKQRIKEQLTDQPTEKPIPIVPEVYDPLKIYETFGKGLLFTCSKEVFNDWFVTGIGNNPPVKLNNEIPYRQIYFFLRLILTKPDDAKITYFKKVFGVTVEMNDLELRDAKTLKANGTYNEKIRHTFKYQKSLSSCKLITEI